MLLHIHTTNWVGFHPRFPYFIELVGDDVEKYTLTSLCYSHNTFMKHKLLPTAAFNYYLLPF